MAVTDGEMDGPDLSRARVKNNIMHHFFGLCTSLLRSIAEDQIILFLFVMNTARYEYVLTVLY